MSLVNQNRWSTVRRLFESAIDMPTIERGAYLQAECADDSDTRQEVLALLAADEVPFDMPVDRDPDSRHQTDAAENLPEILGFKIVKRIGSGGSSRVFEAICLENGARVALKVINSGSNGQSLLRFRQESRVLSRLSHPGIVRLHETGQTQDGQIYLAMDFVEGQRIDEWCTSHALSAQERVAAVLQMLDALEHAHAAGVIHRDIKPHNILVNTEGQVHLVDFGVARLTREDGNRTGFHTETGNIVGTFAYMSPEQADGKAGRIGPTTDVYQAALVLFQLLTGRLPYEVDDRGAMALLKAVLFERRMLLSEVVPELSGAIEDVISAALNVDPVQRPQSVQLFAAQLQVALAQMD
jgi:serine/threonine-protein kinase